MQPSLNNVPVARLLAITLMAACLAGCEGTKLPSATELPVTIATPQTTAGTSSTAAVAVVPAGQPDQETIIKFRKSSVILYNDANGNDGERTGTASLTVPMIVRTSSSNASRLEITTAAGPRWISRSEVDLIARSPETPSEIKPR